MKKFTALCLTAALCSVLAVPSWPVLSQDRQLPNVPLQSANVGKIIKSYRKQQSGPRPEWVNDALNRSITYLRQNATALSLTNAESEVSLLSADQDDLAMTHVRLDQVWNGVPVFGGQIVTHLDATDKGSINRQPFDFTTGRIFPDARGVNTIPTLTAASAIALAITELGYKGAFARPPEAELVILPEAVKKDREIPGATLTYKVDLLVNDGTTATRPLYFVNAHNGQIEWRYENLQRGTGNSQYSGAVNIGTFFSGIFDMNDQGRSGTNICGASKPGIVSSDFIASGGNPCIVFTDADDVWGNGVSSDRATAGVDAHFAAELTFDYYRNKQNWLSLNNSNYQLANRAHNNGVGADKAFWDGEFANYGDGQPRKGLDVS